MNGDQKSDLVLGTQAATVLLGDGQGAFASPLHFAHKYSLDNSVRNMVVVGDWNGDQLPDLVMVDGNSYTVTPLLNQSQ